MSRLRLLLFIILFFLGNAVTASPNSYEHSEESIEAISQFSDQDKNNTYFDADGIKSESSIQIVGSFRPNVVFSNAISSLQWLRSHKNKIALLYIISSEKIDSNLYSLKIIYPFHYFP
jgi:hypothetical protein